MKKDTEWLKTVLLLLLIFLAAVILAARILVVPAHQDSGSSLEIHPPVDEKSSVVQFVPQAKPARIVERRSAEPEELILTVALYEPEELMAMENLVPSETVNPQ